MGGDLQKVMRWQNGEQKADFLTTLPVSTRSTPSKCNGRGRV